MGAHPVRTKAVVTVIKNTAENFMVSPFAFQISPPSKQTEKKVFPLRGSPLQNKHSIHPDQNQVEEVGPSQ